MKIGQRALSLVLTFAVLTGTFLNTAAFAAEQVWDSNFDSGSVHYHVTDSNFAEKDSGSVEVTYVDSGSDSYTIPAQVVYQDSNYNVTAIADNAFDNTKATEIAATVAGTGISVKSAGNGYVSLAVVDSGAITAKAVPVKGYKLDGWYAAGGERISSSAALTLTQATGYDVTAKFKQITYLSDTNYNITVKGTYTFKITSKDGKAPKFAAGTAGVFKITSAGHNGDDYFFKLTAVGAVGEKAGIFVNDEKLLVAAVGTQFRNFVSDTNGNFAVNYTYQIKITTDGTVPTFSIGTSGVFTAQFVTRYKNSYYYKLTAVGRQGANAGVYVNGVKLLVATVGKSVNTVTSDTNGSFKVKSGKSYIIKLTAYQRPTLKSGSSPFKVVYLNSVGNNYFYRVTAVGKVKAAAGFYVNSSKTPVAVATIA